MSLDTKITYAEPDVKITVDDDGGGDRKHKVDLLVRWDPGLLKTEGTVVPSVRSILFKTFGVCVWHNHDVLAAGKDFFIDLKKKVKGDAVVHAVAVDKFKGEIKSAHFVIKDKEKALDKKAKKKAKKKA